MVWQRQLDRTVTLDDAKDIISKFAKLDIATSSCAELFADAFDLSVRNKLATYDMLFLALAIRESCELVTADKKMLDAVKESYQQVIWVADWK